MPDEYKYAIAQCDIPAERRSSLETFRAKRRVWLGWINTDEHHAIWTTINSMVWTDAAFKTLADFGANDPTNGLNNPLVIEALLSGHVATQVLSIRRLMDNGSSGIISLRRLVKDLKRDFALLTRENYVCYDGLPYDYLAVRQANFEKHAGNGFPKPDANDPALGRDLDGARFRVTSRPVGAVLFSIQHTQIGHQMPFVVTSQKGRRWRLVGDVRIERWHLRGQSLNDGVRE
jgi:hypothetical protein